LYSPVIVPHIGEEFGDEGNAERVAGQERDAADLSGSDAYVVLAGVAALRVLVDELLGHLPFFSFGG
jgi:hypothetical protein